MTAILQEIRRLDAARARGEISELQFAKLRTEILTAIEDVELVEPVDETDTASDNVAPPQGAHLFVLALLLILAAVAFTTLTALIIGDVTLALTLAVTLLAAFCVGAYRKLEGLEPEKLQSLNPLDALNRRE